MRTGKTSRHFTHERAARSKHSKQVWLQPVNRTTKVVSKEFEHVLRLAKYNGVCVCVTVCVCV